MINRILMDVVTTIGSASAKAHASGAVAALVVLAGPAVDGFRAGLAPPLAEAGAMLGSALGAYIVGHMAAWLPGNRDGRGAERRR